MNILNFYAEAISKLCIEHKLKKLHVFGSVLTDKFNDKSNVDLLVDFINVPFEDYADNYFDFKFSLQDIFKRDIDLLEEKALKNSYLKLSILQNSRLIYG